MIAITLRDIIAAVCAASGVDPSRLRTKDRGEVTVARTAITYLARTACLHPVAYEEIAIHCYPKPSHTSSYCAFEVARMAIEAGPKATRKQRIIRSLIDTAEESVRLRMTTRTVRLMGQSQLARSKAANGNDKRPPIQYLGVAAGAQEARAVGPQHGPGHVARRGA